MADIAKVKHCPVCGSSKIQTESESRKLKVPFVSDAKYEAIVDVCQECATRGDFCRENSARITASVEKAKQESVVRIIAGLAEKKYTMASMERALGLAQRTMNRWKGGEFSDSSLALLRFIATYPWLVEVADAQFDPKFAQERLMMEAVRVVNGIAESRGMASCVMSHTDPTTARVSGVFTTQDDFPDSARVNILTTANTNTEFPIAA